MDFNELKDTIYKDDLLNRLPFAESLYNLIAKEKPILQDNDSLVVAIDAPWGTGKTYFLNLFEKTLGKLNEDNKNNFTIVKYNAWQNDDFDEPLLSLLYCLIKQQVTRKEIKEELKEQGVKLIEKVAVPVILDMIKIKTGFDADKAFKIAKDVIDVENSKTFEKYEKAIKKKDIFKSLMAKLSKDSKVIVLIDELDRCRPTYAIELLETIKHYLNVENYIFVFALDKSQLSHSIKTLYGNNMDSIGYLRRFFDYVLNFPIPNTSSYIKSLISEIELDKRKQNKLINALVYMKQAFSLSYRDMNVILNSFLVLWESVLHSQTSNHYMMEAYIFLIIIKYKYPRYFNALLEFDINDAEIDRPKYAYSTTYRVMHACHEMINKPDFYKLRIDDDLFRHLNRAKVEQTYLPNNKEDEKFFDIELIDDNDEGKVIYAKFFFLDETSSFMIGEQLSQQLEMISIEKRQLIINT